MSSLESVSVQLKRSLSGEAKSADTKTKERARRFLSPDQRNLTETYKRLLLAEFRRAHKVDLPVKGSGARSARGAASGVDELQGQAHTRPPLYDHQRNAIKGLDSLLLEPKALRRGLVVLPTGGGKTCTAVTWIVERMAANKKLRVLWLAHQQELLEQAAREFRAQAATQPAAFARRLRVISSGHSPVSTITDPSLDVAIVTWQSLHANWDKHSGMLKTFTARPTIVVVDEAHHASAQGYQQILGSLQLPAGSVMIGLTATPWPSGSQALRNLRETFPSTVADVTSDELHALGLLAAPILHTIETHQAFELDPDELKAARGDLPASVLNRLRNDARDSLLTRVWLRDPAGWGKTLVFAATQRHADDIASRFERAGVDCKALHSNVPDSPADVLRWFRAGRNPRVLVSVGMLTEGVDLPDAKTAILARPTTSRVLMRQMIGRVLRGPQAGGTSTAHIVYLRDMWTNFDEILDPGELPDLVATPAPTSDGAAARTLPPILDEEDGQAIREDVLAQIQRMYQRRTDRIPIDPAMSSTRLCGYYVTAERNVPVMEHQRDGYEHFIADVVKATSSGSGLRGKAALGYFDDDYPPYPTSRSLETVRTHIRDTGAPPPFISRTASLDPRDIAKRLRNLTAVKESEREAWLSQQYESTLARIAYPTFDHFEEAVERELREMRQAQRAGRNPLNAERPTAPTRQTKPSTPRRPLMRQPSRQLPSLPSVIAKMRSVLAGEEALEWMPGGDQLPRLLWTHRPIASAWAHWSLKTSGRSAGRPVIRVNRLLQAPRTQVGDDVLEYLVFHEMLHDLLPGRGHDAEFRRLEALWPDGARLDRELDTLHEQFELRHVVAR
jgi:superfamily II DNA or RNA helicase